MIKPSEEVHSLRPGDFVYYMDSADNKINACVRSTHGRFIKIGAFHPDGHCVMKVLAETLTRQGSTACTA